LAQELQTTTQTIYRWEAGNPPRPSAVRSIEAFLRAGADENVSYLPSGDHRGAVHTTEQRRAIQAASSRLSSGVPLSQGEIALLRALFNAVDLEWPDG
jgi:hypothetical protein